jgi:DNA repair protein RecN (Recombination protein N)
MLSEIRIIDFAIIDKLELSFLPGLNVLTGETGAGKSIIIDAVEMILGGRADSLMIRSGSNAAIIEAVFKIPSAFREQVHAILLREGLLDEPDFLTLAREIRSNGRNIARLNGRTVSVGLMAEVGEYLVDVHGQSEHLSLMRVRQHLGLLDSFAGVDAELAVYQNTYHRLQTVRKELEHLKLSESESARRVDVLTYQINEIEAARLHPGEEEELKEERNRLANAESLASLSQEAILLLDESPPEAQAASDLIGQTVSALRELSRLDPSQSAILEQAELIFDSINELARSLRDYVDSLEYNPKRLNQVEERLNLIHNLKRKYGADIPAVLEFVINARRELDAMSNAAERIAELETEELELLGRLAIEGTALTAKRQSAAQRLEKAVESELSNLNMGNARFKVDFIQRLDPDGVPIVDGKKIAFDSTGLEKIEFLVAPNPGEGLKPLIKIASGGETSRLMLAIKNVLARADQVPTLIFDEIDQGIGGRIGTIVGRKLWDLAQEHQVLCVTHLPQLAAYGEQHIRVRKVTTGGRTITKVEALQAEERLLELASMMGEVSEGTRRSAQELLQTVGDVRKGR